MFSRHRSEEEIGENLKKAILSWSLKECRTGTYVTLMGNAPCHKILGSLRLKLSWRKELGFLRQRKINPNYLGVPSLAFITEKNNFRKGKSSEVR